MKRTTRLAAPYARAELLAFAGFAGTGRCNRRRPCSRRRKTSDNCVHDSDMGGERNNRIVVKTCSSLSGRGTDGYGWMGVWMYGCEVVYFGREGRRKEWQVRSDQVGQ
jgi:hypothetical protein